MSESQPTDDELAAVELSNIIEELSGAPNGHVETSSSLDPSPGVVVRCTNASALSDVMQTVSEYTDSWAAQATHGANTVGVLTYDLTIQDMDKVSDRDASHYTVFIEDIEAEWDDE